MMISRISGYTPLRSSQSFGMKFNSSAKKVVEKAKEEAITRNSSNNTNKYTDQFNYYLNIIKKYKPQSRLSITSTPNLKLRGIDNETITTTLYEAKIGKEIIYSDRSVHPFNFIKDFAYFIAGQNNKQK